MLAELRIANFAVIDRLSLEFSAGFQVLTGETGAGKSIIVDAIALLVGGRATADQIRSDAEEAHLEAAFALPSVHPLTARLRELGVLGPTETELIIRRILSRAGRHRVYLNGSLTPLHVVQSLAGTLVDIHGQHEQQSLLSSQAQLDALDAFGHLQELRHEYAVQYARWKDRQRDLLEAERLAAERAAREDLLRFQHHELEEAHLVPGEEERLTAERQRLAHARRLSELQQEAYEVLYGGDMSVLTSLGLVSHRLQELSGIDPETAEWSALAEEAAAQLRELARQLRAYRQRLDEDPERLAQVEERLERLQRLKRKYGGTEESLLVRMQELKQELDELAAAETKIAELREQVAKDRERLESLAGRLSTARVQAAAKMEKKIQTELAALRMDHTRFRIEVRSQENGTPGPTGRDQVEYLLSANPGEPLHPLAKVASGGELSRIMLAIKTVLAETDNVPVLIFDEVDTGIGGAVAAVMGQRLRALAEYHQVFCITHLPQVASQAQAHYLVRKSVVKKRAITEVIALDRAGRQEEIARMLGGLAITPAVRQMAAEMIGEREGES